MSLRSLSLMDLYQRNARLFPQHPALIDGDRVLSFQDLLEESRALQNGLAAAGLQPGERIAVLARNSLHFFPLLGAVSALGAILVLINRRLSKEEILEILDDTSPVMLISDRDILETARAVRAQCPGIGSHFILQGRGQDSFARLLKDGHASSRPQYREPSRDEPFAVIHTAAVQGKPRGAVLSQENLILASVQLTSTLKLDRADCYLNILPLFHIMGLNLALAVMLAGGRNLIMTQFDPDLALEYIHEQRVSLLGTFPPILAKLLEADSPSNRKTESLRQVLGLEQPETIIQCQEKTKARFWTIYGQTETSGLITLAPYDEQPGAAGRPGHLVNLKVVDEFDRDLPSGETGEIVIRGPLVFQGYWQQPELNKLTFREKWHHTGDLGILAENGFLFFKGRKAEKDLIKSGGENVFPVEVEKVILENPAVEEVSVIGVPDPTFGEGIKAVCVLKSGQSIPEAELVSFVGSRIAGYKKPRFVQFVDALPKDQAGVIDRVRVKELYGEV
ncbi:MAG: AMP-binding protein [Desulfohalobiaceae bacterium]|nr:AMP-binding protein [Desulfohalobiaceae bacterium]